MGLKYTHEPKSFELPPEGVHLARCYQIVDLGRHEVTFAGDTKIQHKVLLSFELPECETSSGEPMTLHQQFNFSMHEKARLRRMLDTWLGSSRVAAELKARTFDITQVIGEACQVTISHSVSGERTYANISGVLPLRAGEQCPPLKNTTNVFDLDDYRADELEALPKWVREKIEARIPEPPRPKPEPVGAQAEPFDDDINF